MTISLVVETCRKSARNDLVKSVLASSHFETPKGVLSKFVTEVANQNKDKQFLAYKRQEFIPRRGNGFSRGGFRRNNWPNNGQSHNYQPPSNYQWRGNSNGSQPNNRGGTSRPQTNYSRPGNNQSVCTITAEESENQ